MELVQLPQMIQMIVDCSHLGEGEGTARSCGATNVVRIRGAKPRGSKHDIKCWRCKRRLEF